MFSILMIAYLIKISISRDVYTVEGNFGVGAQTMDYVNDRIAISRNSDDAIIIYNAGTNNIYRTITSLHKANILTIGFDSTGVKIVSGGSDFLINVYSLTSSNLICKFTELHGTISETKFLTDNIRVIAVTDAGYAYIWNTSNCRELYRRVFNGQILTSITQNTASNQIWISNYQSTIYRVGYDLNNTGTSFTVPTRRLKSLFKIGSTNYIGVCTQDAFYLYNNLALAHTRNHLASPTNKCRVSPNWQGGYFITAASLYRQLFTVWKLQLSTPTTWQVRVQYNDGRHGSINPHTAQLNYYNYNTLEIASSSINSGYIRNQFLDTTTTLCDDGTISSTRVLGTSKCTLCVDIISNQACYKCTSDTNCGICYANYYLDSPSKDCLRCPQTCYNCSSSTICTSCITNYIISGSNCVSCALSSPNCVDCYNAGSLIGCNQCLPGFYLLGNKGCQACNYSMQNCLQCSNSTVCTKCSPSYKLLSSSQGCQSCSMLINGCIDCLNSTYCDTCNTTSYPYYHKLSSSNRICEVSCYYLCLSCSFYYDDCSTCDVNRTRYLVSVAAGYSCSCNSNYFQDSITKKCLQCSYYISNCLTCTNTSFCSACATNYYYDPYALGYRNCKICNYSCLTCSTTYYDCASCNSTSNRVLSSNRCVCTNLSYYQVINNSICLKCSDFLTNCLTCYNASYCLTCSSAYYVRNILSGNQDCQSCGPTCSSCSLSSNNCTSCFGNQNRQLNVTGYSCNCQSGYYNNGSNICRKCSDDLGSCLSCVNSSVCLSCAVGTYFENITGKIECKSCSSNCSTCNGWTTNCSTCQAGLNQILNIATFKCDCMFGYTLISGVCLNCNYSFIHCTDCNLTHCLSCQNGYALSSNQIQCVNCTQIMIGCLLCLNGICAECDSNKSYVLSKTKCICKAGYYLKDNNCLSYAMGVQLQRYFRVVSYYYQNYTSKNIIIRTKFGTSQVNFPNGLNNSIKLKINEVYITNYTYLKTVNELVVAFKINQTISRGQISLEFLENNIYDKDQYQPYKQDRLKIFTKNIYNTEVSEIFSTISKIIQQKINLIIKCIATILLLFGSIDTFLLFLSIYQLLPIYLLTGLSLPGQITVIFNSMLSLNLSSIFIFPYSDKIFSFKDQPQNYKILGQYQIGNSFIQNKIIDIIFITIVFLLYGFLGQLLLKFLEPGKIYKLIFRKFVQKRYSTLSNSILSLLISFVLSTVLNFYNFSFHSILSSIPLVANFLTIGLALVISTFFGSLIFAHINAVEILLRDDNDTKTDDCYFGASKIHYCSSQYLLSEIIYWLFVPLTILYLNSIAFLAIGLLLLLSNLYYYQYWDLISNKILYFCKLFRAIFLLIFHITLIIFFLSENYLQMSISLLAIIQYLTIASTAIILILSLITGLIMIGQSIISISRINPNIIDSLGVEDQSLSKKLEIKNLESISGKEDIISIDEMISTPYSKSVLTSNSLFTRNKRVLNRKDQ